MPYNSLEDNILANKLQSRLRSDRLKVVAAEQDAQVNELRHLHHVLQGKAAN